MDSVKKHSTQHAKLGIINSIQGNMDRRLYSCGILIDLKKAFDTADHRILLGKLYFYGFRGVLHNWFLSYLTGRKQTTEVRGRISSSETGELKQPRPRRQQKPNKFAYLTMKNSISARFARALIFSSFDLLKTFSFFLRCEMTCFAVV